MSRILSLLGASSAFVLVTPAIAQDHSMHNMPGMTRPVAPAPVPKAKARATAKSTTKKPLTRPSSAKKASPAKPAAPTNAHEGHDMSGMDHSTMQGTADQSSGTSADKPMQDMDHRSMPGVEMQGDMTGHDMGLMSGMQPTGTALPAGNAPAPETPADHYADRQFSAQEMAHARMEMMRDSGSQAFGQALLNIFEYQLHSGRDGYRWDGEAWYGGDINRVWLKSEGEGEAKGRLDSAEVQVLYSKAIDPYFNLQAGVRQDIRPTPARTYATVGFEGLAPGFFEVEGTIFLSNKGDVLGRLEGYYDQRISQRLIFQPRIELNLSAQDIPENDIGSGIVDVELGARLRYEITRQFGPYVGVSYLRKAGDTARYARLNGEDVHSKSLVMGIRFWF